MLKKHPELIEKKIKNLKKIFVESLGAKINQWQIYLVPIVIFFSLDQLWYSFEVPSRIGTWFWGITFAAVMSSQLLSTFNTLINLMHNVIMYVVTWTKVLLIKRFYFFFFNAQFGIRFFSVPEIISRSKFQGMSFQHYVIQKLLEVHLKQPVIQRKYRKICKISIVTMRR